MIPDPPARLRLDRLELAFILFFTLTACLLWAGITLAAFGVFRGATLLCLAVPLAVVGGTWIWRSLGPLRAASPAGPSTWWFVCLLTVMSAVLFGRPMEAIMGTEDAPVYVSVAHTIMRTGGIAQHDPLLDLIPVADRASLFSQSRRPYTLLRFRGGVNIDGNRSVGSFLHLFPAAGASLGLAFGPYGAFYVNPLLAGANLIVVFLIGRRVSSPLAGAMGATLLALNFGQVWFARLPLSEMLGQYLLMSGALFTMFFLERGPAIVGLLAGAAFGLAALARLDAFVFVIPLVALFLVVARSLDVDRWAWRWFAGALLAGTVHAVLHYYLVAGAYTTNLLIRLMQPFIDRDWRVLVVVLAAGAPAVVWWLLRAKAQIQPGRRMVMAIAVLALGLLALRMGPLLVSSAFARMISPIGGIATLAGLVLLLRRGSDFRVLFLATIFLGTTLIFIQGQVENSNLPFGLRRYIPVALPLAMVFASHLTVTLASSRRRLSALAYALPLVMGAWFIHDTLPILRTAPMQGIYRQVAAISDRIPERALLLADPSLPNHLATSLNYVFERLTFVPRRTGPAEARRRLVDRALAGGRPVFLMTTARGEGGGMVIQRAELEGLAVRPVGIVTWSYANPRVGSVRLPRSPRRSEGSMELYEVMRPGDPGLRAGLPLRMDIGELDFGYVLRGFFGREGEGRGASRWIGGRAELAIPPIAAAPSASVTVSLRLSAYRPSRMPPARMVVSLNGRTIGHTEALDRELRVYRFPLASEDVRMLEPAGGVLTIAATTFVPSESGVGRDQRRLGAKVDWVALEVSDRARPGPD